MKVQSLFAVLVLGIFASISTFAEAVQWGNIDRGEHLILKKKLKINASLSLKSGGVFIVDEITSLNEIQVELFSVTLSPCESRLDSAIVSMTILNNLYGFEMQPHCQIQFYVELKDLFLNSYFEKLNP